jgi:hypothetical protein
MWGFWISDLKISHSQKHKKYEKKKQYKMTPPKVNNPAVKNTKDSMVTKNLEEWLWVIKEIKEEKNKHLNNFKKEYK